MNLLHPVEDSQGARQPELTSCLIEQALLLVDVQSFNLSPHNADRSLNDPGETVEQRHEWNEVRVLSPADKARK